MKICGACEKELPRESFSGKQWKLRRSIRRCASCVAAGNELVLFTKGRKRSEDDECPVCSRLLPLEGELEGESSLLPCCMKTVCHGCLHIVVRRGMLNCPFCRTPLPSKDSEREVLSMIQTRVRADDPVAIHLLGICYGNGSYGLEKDAAKVVELFEQAAELGFKESHFKLGTLFSKYKDPNSYADVASDMIRSVEHFEIAAKQGHHLARNNLGVYELDSGNHGLALKHFMISAKLGCGISLGTIKKMYTKGQAPKADYAEALRGYHDAMTEMSSPERDDAKEQQRDQENRHCFKAYQ